MMAIPKHEIASAPHMWPSRAEALGTCVEGHCTGHQPVQLHIVAEVKPKTSETQNFPEILAGLFPQNIADLLGFQSKPNIKPCYRVIGGY